MLTFLRWGLLRRRAAPPLPAALRDRLLAIPATVTRRPVEVPRSFADEGGLTWLLVSPLSPLAAGFVLALALSLAWGNPYEVGAAALDRVRDRAAPATASVRVGATAVAEVAAELGETMAALPRAGVRATRAVTATLQGRMNDDARTRRHDERSNPGG